MTGSIPHKATVNDIDMMGLAIPFPHQPRSRSEARDLLGATSGEELVRAGDLAFELSTKAGFQGPECCHLDRISLGEFEERSATASRRLVAKPLSPSLGKFPAR